MLDEFIKILERKVEYERRALENHVARKCWFLASQQQSYLIGLADVLHIARAFYVANKDESERVNDDTAMS